MKLKGIIHNVFSSTLVRYISSYALVFTVMFSGFYVIIYRLFFDMYYEQLIHQSQVKLSSMSNQLINELEGLETVASSLKESVNILLAENSNDNYLQYKIFKELDKYRVGKTYVESILYYNEEADILLSPGVLTTWNDKGIHFTGSDSLIIDYSELTRNVSSHMVYLKEKNRGYLLFFPTNSRFDRQRVCFILDKREVEQLCKDFSSNEMPSVALIDANKNIIAGWNAAIFDQYTDIYETENGLYVVDENKSLYVIKNVELDFSIVALISKDYLLNQVHLAFQPIFTSLMVIGGIAIWAVAYAVYCTYFPLKKLVYKVVPWEKRKQNHLATLEQIIEENNQKKEEVETRLNHYRSSVHKAILNAVSSEKQLKFANEATGVEDFFEMGPNNSIYVVNIYLPNECIGYEEIVSEFRNMLGGNVSNVILNIAEKNIVFGVCFGREENEQHKSLYVEFLKLFERYGCYIVVSERSESPLHIPMLYEATKGVRGLCGENPVIFIEGIPEVLHDTKLESAIEYPRDIIANLLYELSAKNSIAAERQISRLFEIMDNYEYAEKNIYSYYVCHILSDILYGIANALNSCNIKWDIYKGDYLTILQVCQSFSYNEDKEIVKTRIGKLMGIFAEYVKNKIDFDNSVRKLISDNYMNSDISISYIAEYFGVSVSNASLLVKKATGANFVEYLWNIRLDRTKELLVMTDESIDTICTKIGYDNASSFRRKFKKEMGMSPSEYREMFKNR